mgnify:CR=1 FL=1|jgi:hypothetical protein
MRALLRFSKLPSMSCCMLLLFGFLYMVSAATDTSEVDGLENIYNVLDGPNWINRGGWLVGSDPCGDNWYGIKCIQNHITSISLDYNGLNGNWPSDFGNFPFLKYLSLKHNSIGGSLSANSSAFCSSVSLEQIYLDGNLLLGSLPVCFCTCPALRILSLSSNQFSSSPSCWGENSGSILEQYLVSNNSFTFIEPSLGALVELRHLDLSTNQLQGEIPSRLSQLQNLVSLNLDNNNLKNSPIEVLKGCRSLQLLSLSNNKLLQFEISDFFQPGQFPYLTIFNAINAGIHGSFPPALSQFSSLTHLNLGFNSIDGEVNSSIILLPNLAYLSFAYNKLEGKLPPLLSDSIEAHWEGNSFECPIPSGSAYQTASCSCPVGWGGSRSKECEECVGDTFSNGETICISCGVDTQPTSDHGSCARCAFGTFYLAITGIGSCHSVVLFTGGVVSFALFFALSCYAVITTLSYAIGGKQIRHWKESMWIRSNTMPDQSEPDKDSGSYIAVPSDDSYFRPTDEQVDEMKHIPEEDE